MVVALVMTGTVAEAAPPATVTVAGSVMRGSLLDKATTVPTAGAGALRVTVAWGAAPSPVAVKPERVWAKLVRGSASSARRTNRASKACIRLRRGRADEAEPRRGGHAVPTF